MKGAIITIGIICLIAASLVVGFLVWSITQPCTQPQEVVGGREIDTSDLPAEDLSQEGWLTYRNEEYGFEFKYPGDLELCEISNKYVSLEQNGRCDVRYDENIDNYNISINITSPDTNLMGWYEYPQLGRGSIGILVESELTKLGNKEVYKQVVEGTGFMNEYKSIRKLISIYFPNEEQTLLVEINFGLKKDDYDNHYAKLIDEFVKNFNFLNK